MQNAAERLLGMKLAQIQELAKDIIFGQLRLVIATMDIEEINTDRDKFLEAVSRNVEGELKKIGLRLINVNVTDISDESGYIIALGKEAAAKAINDAKISVAEADRSGAIGEANAKKEQRINVANYNSEAIKGEKNALADREAKCRAKAEQLKVWLAEALNGQKFATAKCAVSFRRSEQVDITDLDSIPKELTTETVTVKPDKTAIKALIKGGSEVPGCRLIENLNPQIK
jgi:flotillin